MPERQMHSRTKIVATLGPSTDSIEVLTEMVRAGLDVARVNFSHGKHEEHGRRIDLVHEAARRAGRYVGILADLGGPKIRIESFTNKKVDLKDGQAFALDTAHDINAGNEQVVGCAYKDLPKDVKAGNILLLNDGLIELEVTKVSGTRIDTKVIAGGELSNRKGVNLKGGGISAPALTDKDREDIKFACMQGCRLRRRVFPARCRGHEPRARSACAPPAVTRTCAPRSSVTRPSTTSPRSSTRRTCVMVARGDLGVEMGYAAITGLQKTIIHESRTRNKVVITATQMMESMITSPVPTRAEVSDVANAVMDGTDAVMLSAESAVGKHPIKADPGDGRSHRRRREIRDHAQPHAASRRRHRRSHRRSHRDGGDVHRQSHEGARHRRAHRIRHHAAVDVARPLGHSYLRIHAPRIDAPPRHAVSRRVPRAFRHSRKCAPTSCSRPSSR